MKPEEGLNMAALQSTKLLHEKVSMTHLIVTPVSYGSYNQCQLLLHILIFCGHYQRLLFWCPMTLFFMTFWQYPYYCFLHQLTHHVDVIEVHLAHQISLRSDVFFSTLASQRELESLVVQIKQDVLELRYLLLYCLLVVLYAYILCRSYWFTCTCNFAYELSSA